MFGIGGPELLIIAIVALVVVGPERLPEVMRRVGAIYRQFRDLSGQLTSEAQRFMDESMKEVESATTTVSTAFETPAALPAPEPPPKLRQVPPPEQAPLTAADAGPAILAAWYRDMNNDREVSPGQPSTAPTALPRLAPQAESMFEDLGNVGGPMLMGPPPTAEELAELEAQYAAGEEDELPVDEMPLEGESDRALAALQLNENVPTMEPDVPIEPPLGRPAREERGLAETALPAHAAPHAANGTSGDAPATDRNGATPTQPDPVALERELTVIELYRSGALTQKKAAEFLGLTPRAFKQRVAALESGQLSVASGQ